MEHLQQERLRRQPLGVAPLVAAGLAFIWPTAAHAAGHELPVRGTKPPMHLQQTGRTTFLTQTSAPPLKVALTHNGTYPQGLNPPFAAAAVASIPGHVLIFTDSFASNPGNIQGQCGASPEGERYLHVIALSGTPHETLSTLIESCWQNMLPAQAPHWDAATRLLKVDLLSNDNGPLTMIFHLAAEGEVLK